jgi:hypothetical protein
MTKDDFDPRNYWRGPVWININWMLSQGLKRSGYTEKADAMKRDMIQLPIRFGFHEYFDSQTGRGYGSSDFSWTAALFLDLVYDYYNEDRYHLGWLSPARKGKPKEKRVLNGAGSPRASVSKDVASNLMAAIGDLREKFYDPHRGRVDYEAIKHSSEYRRYHEWSTQLHGFDLGNLHSREEKLAFWVNLYNAIVVHGIIELGIRASVREVPHFFSRMGYQIGAFFFTPDDMEHGILRANARPPHRIFPLFGRNDPRRRFALQEMDPRVHFALVCGSRSCAPIRFYEGGKMDEQLELAARRFVNSSEVVLLPEENKIFLSEIFDWYARDFGGKEKIFSFLQGYLDNEEKRLFLEKHRDQITVEYLFYDWNLNH